MVKIDYYEERMKKKYGPKIKKVLEDFRKEQKKKGREFCFPSLCNAAWNKEAGEPVFDYRFVDIFKQPGERDEPKITVYQEKYFDLAKDVAEKIEKEIGLEVLLVQEYGELY